ncbi:WSC-domain-containing protein [Teratosphaeria destructans]|uniref:WSC-domain-containing protein n=1 Tax=Teratosphaeria destructans TaxID=418781 RepID=A0A9W7T0M9_9PEZI|nr:WSC-domain-containing protein [Teratosphaeria destructans]
MRPFATTWTSFVLAAGLAAAQNSFTCPAMDRYLVTDSNGISYVIGCSSDSTNGNFAQSSVSNSFNDCFSICDSTSGCTCFTYGGGSNGVGSGFCYLKNSANFASEAFIAENNNDYVAAVSSHSPHDRRIDTYRTCKMSDPNPILHRHHQRHSDDHSSRYAFPLPALDGNTIASWNRECLAQFFIHQKIADVFSRPTATRTATYTQPGMEMKIPTVPIADFRSIHRHGHIHLSHDLNFYLYHFLSRYLHNYTVCKYHNNRFVLDSDSH